MATTGTQPNNYLYNTIGQVASSLLSPYIGNYANPLVSGIAKGVGEGQWYGPQFAGGVGGTIGSMLGKGTPYQNLYGKAGALAGGGLGTYLQYASDQTANPLRNTLTSPNVMGGAGSLLGAAVGGQNANLWSGVGGLAGNIGGSVLTNYLNNQPLTQGMNAGGIGGGVGSLLGGLLGQKNPVLGTIGSTVGGIAGEALAPALVGLLKGDTLGTAISNFGSNIGSSFTGSTGSTGGGLGGALGVPLSIVSSILGLYGLSKNWDKMDAGQKVTGVIDTVAPQILANTIGSSIPGLNIALAIGQALVNQQRKAVAKGAAKLGPSVYEGENFVKYSQGQAAGNLMYGPGSIFASIGKSKEEKKRFERKLRGQIANQFSSIETEAMPGAFWAGGTGGLNQDLSNDIVNSFAGKGRILAGARAQATANYGTPEQMWAVAQKNLPTWLTSKGFGAGWSPSDPTRNLSNQWETGNIEADEAAVQNPMIQKNLQNYMGTRIMQELQKSGRIGATPTTPEEYAAAMEAWQGVPMAEAGKWWTGPQNLTDLQFQEAYGMSPARYAWLARNVPGSGLAPGMKEVAQQAPGIDPRVIPNPDLSALRVGFDPTNLTPLAPPLPPAEPVNYGGW